MKKIYDQKKKKFVRVGVLKNLTFRSAPGFKFFLHKSLGEDGFTVSEEISGCFIVQAVKSKTAAINEARGKLQFQGVERLRDAIKRSLEVQNDQARI